MLVTLPATRTTLPLDALMAPYCINTIVSVTKAHDAAGGLFTIAKPHAATFTGQSKFESLMRASDDIIVVAGMTTHSTDGKLDAEKHCETLKLQR